MATQQDDMSVAGRTSIEADPKAVAPVMHDEHRTAVEKSLKRKLDLRCSIFVLIYIMSEWLPLAREWVARLP